MEHGAEDMQHVDIENGHSSSTFIDDVMPIDELILRGRLHELTFSQVAASAKAGSAADIAEHARLDVSAIASFGAASIGDDPAQHAHKGTLTQNASSNMTAALSMASIGTVITFDAD